MTDIRSGSCLCGEVSFQVEPFPSSQACHCSNCRTWGGGPFISVPCKTAEFDGEIKRYASSDHAERGFCPSCGTHLFFHATGPGVYAVPLGLFEDDSGLPFRAEIFIDEKPDAYAFAGDTKKLTGAEFAAKFR